MITKMFIIVSFLGAFPLAHAQEENDLCPNQAWTTVAITDTTRNHVFESAGGVAREKCFIAKRFEEVMKTQQARLKFCFERALQIDPAITSLILTTAVEIKAGGGRFLTINPVASLISDEAFRSIRTCFITQMAQMQFGTQFTDSILVGNMRLVNQR